MNKKIIETTFGWGSGHTWLHTTLEGPWPHYMVVEVCWDGVWTLFFWAFTIFMVTALGSCVKWPLARLSITEHSKSTTSLHWLKMHGWGPGHIWLHTTLEGPWPHYMILEVCCDGLWTRFFWALTIFMVTALGSCVKWPLAWLNVTEHANSTTSLHWRKMHVMH
jgi:hypothetical protein